MNDAEVIIMEVEKRPILWDITDGNFKDKDKKFAAWIEVSACLFEDNMPTSEAEQKVIVQDVTAKWRSIRDNYVRSCRKQSEASTASGTNTKRVKRYCYEKQLLFLEKNIKPRAKGTKKKRSSSYMNVEEYSCSGSDNGTDLLNRQTTSTDSKKLTSMKITPAKMKIEDEISNMEAHQPKKEDSFQDDEDLAFFHSLMPTVRSLNFDQKFSFRIQTMQLLQNVKSLSQ